MQRYVEADPRQVLADEVYPKEASLRTKLAYLLNYAVLAPSSHNSQPWRFRLEETAVSLYADRSRALPVVDPQDRELIMSCGTALLTLRVALLRYGLTPRVTVFPRPHLPDLLATVDIESRAGPDLSALPLFEAIGRRRTNRGRFEAVAVPDDAVTMLTGAAELEGVAVRVLGGAAEKGDVAELIAEGDRVQAEDPDFRRELAAWVRPAGSGLPDGMPGWALGMEGVASYVGPLLLRTFDWGNRQGARDRQIAEGSPVLLVLWTARDDQVAWLAAGQALARVLLTATTEGLSASFLNQPVEVGALRQRLRSGLGIEGHPQAILRVGVGRPVRPTPRRRVADVLAGASDL